VAELCESKFEPIYEEQREGDIRVSVGDPALCKMLLGWERATNLNEGLRQVIDWLNHRV
jgi:UDP-glucose 4-epimerase